MREYKILSNKYQVGQIATNDAYDACLMLAMVDEEFGNRTGYCRRYFFGEQEGWQYVTIMVTKRKDLETIRLILKTLDENNVYYETDFDLPTTED